MITAAVSLLFAWSAVGLVVAAWLSNAPAGPGYWRLVGLLSFAGAALGLGMRLGGLTPGLTPPPAPVLAAYGLAGLALTGAIVARALAADRAALVSLSVAALAGVLAVAIDPAAASASTAGVAGATYRVGMVTVGLALGSVLLAMLLAHWYLVEPRLPIAPLNRALGLFLALEALKAVLLLAVVVVHLPAWHAAPGGLVRALTLGDGLFLAVRAVLGVAAPIALGWMTWKTVQIRSIQSATGILYAAIVFVLFGEVISLVLSLSTGQPF